VPSRASTCCAKLPLSCLIPQHGLLGSGLLCARYCSERRFHNINSVDRHLPLLMQKELSWKLTLVSHNMPHNAAPADTHATAWAARICASLCTTFRRKEIPQHTSGSLTSAAHDAKRTILELDPREPQHAAQRCPCPASYHSMGCQDLFIFLHDIAQKGDYTTYIRLMGISCS
jgi:hypothetical protein